MQVVTDENLPFVNDITSVVIDSAGNYSQHWLGEFPVLNDTERKRLRFGANAEFFLADGIQTFDNGVIKLDASRHRRAWATSSAGLVTNGPHVRNRPGVTSAASNTIFRVVLIPVPEPATGLLLGVAGLAAIGIVCFRANVTAVAARCWRMFVTLNCI